MGGVSEALVVAGSAPQAVRWAGRMFPDGQGTRVHIWTGAGGREPFDGREFEEAFFVGEWGQLSATELGAVWGALIGIPPALPEIPITYVCDAHGEVLVHPRRWWRWPAASTGRMTAWHVPVDVAASGIPEGLPLPAWTTICGIPASLSPEDQEVTRWGPPPGACKACVLLDAKEPAGPPGEYGARAAAANVAEQALRHGKAHERFARAANVMGGMTPLSRALSRETAYASLSAASRTAAESYLMRQSPGEIGNG
jgi:hypothetical protein